MHLKRTSDARQTHLKRSLERIQTHFKCAANALETHVKRMSNAPETHLGTHSNAPQMHLKRASNARQTHLKRTLERFQTRLKCAANAPETHPHQKRTLKLFKRISNARQMHFIRSHIYGKCRDLYERGTSVHLVYLFLTQIKGFANLSRSVLTHSKHSISTECLLLMSTKSAVAVLIVKTHMK